MKYAIHDKTLPRAVGGISHPAAQPSFRTNVRNLATPDLPVVDRTGRRQRSIPRQTVPAVASPCRWL
jgi:hypothetical protein